LGYVLGDTMPEENKNIFKLPERLLPKKKTTNK
jgi:hypothetical protein